MSVLSWFTDLGLKVSLDGGDALKIDGLHKLRPYHVKATINYAKQNKPTLLAELRAQERGECPPLPEAM